MDYLYLKWFDYKTNKKYVIGALYRRNGKYYFKLVKDYLKLVEKINFPSNTIPFNNENKIYESKNLFSIFKVMLPEANKLSEEEIKELLKEYNLYTYDEFELLKATKGKLRLDNFFVEGEI